MNSLDARPSKPRVGGSIPSRRATRPTPRDVERGSASAGGGIGLFGATFLVLLVLKLSGTLAWSWWWVTAPLWMPLPAVLAIAIVAATIHEAVERGRRR